MRQYITPRSFSSSGFDGSFCVSLDRISAASFGFPFAAASKAAIWRPESELTSNSKDRSASVITWLLEGEWIEEARYSLSPSIDKSDARWIRPSLTEFDGAAKTNTHAAAAVKPAVRTTRNICEVRKRRPTEESVI